MISTARLILTELRADDAEEMVAVLDDEQLHEFTGGQPATLDELRDRYRQLAAGSGDPGEVWLNWIVRERELGNAVGTVQATLVDRAGVREAYIAWIIGVPWQSKGFASEAAIALAGWLRARDVEVVTAHIHPDHTASAKVAARAGLEPTDATVDGETVWQGRG